MAGIMCEPTVQILNSQFKLNLLLKLCVWIYSSKSEFTVEKLNSQFKLIN